MGDAKDVLVVFKAVTKEQMINLFGKDVAAITIYVTDTKGNLVKGKPEGDAVVYVNPARVKDKQIYEEWRHAENDTLDNPNDLRKRTEVNNDIDAHPSRDEGMQRFQRDRQGEEGSLVSGQDPMTLIDGLDTRDPFSGKQ